MPHADAMAQRLPLLYRDGALLRDVLASGPGLALEIVDEDLLEIQRAHWFDSALELEEAARLAAVLDIAPEPWQSLPGFRAWVHALVRALLEHGAVGRRALQVFVEEYTRRFAAAVDLPRLLVSLPRQADHWLVDPAPTSSGRRSRAVMSENPRTLRFLRPPRPAGTEPLDRVEVVNGGLDPSPAGFLLTGVTGGPEHCPLIVDVATGTALAFLGTVPPGQRLWIRPDGSEPGAGVHAELEGRDVSDELRSMSAVVPGTPWSQAQVDPEPRALVLRPGENLLWYLPVAHYDAPGLDRVLLALATLDLAQGRFDEAAFGNALFAQQPAVTLTVAWAERPPATVAVELPAGILSSRAGRLDEALAARDNLGHALGAGVDALAAAGVATTVTLAPLAETQPQGDRLVGRQPLVVRDGGSSGADTFPDAGGLFGVTPYDDSTYR